VTEARVCEQLAQGCYLKVQDRESNPRPTESQFQRPDHYTTTQYILVQFGLKISLRKAHHIEENVIGNVLKLFDGRNNTENEAREYDDESKHITHSFISSQT